MNRKQKKRTVFWTIIFILLLGAGFEALSLDQKKVKAPTGENLFETKQKDEPVLAPAEIKPIDLPKPDYSKLNLPILMYHHIRDYNFEKDQIGTNLSVSPETFRKQLDLIASKGFQTVTFLDILKNEIPDKPIILTFDDGYKNFFENGYPELVRRKMKATVFLISGDIGKDSYLTANEIKTISENGVEIGAHTVSHPDLSTISPEKAKEEIEKSKFDIEKIIGIPIKSFCYPSGKYNDQTKEMVKTAGFDFAVTTNAGTASFLDLYALKRERVNSGTNIEGFLK